MRYPDFVPTINLRLPVLSLTLFAHCYPSQTLLWLNIYQKIFSTHMHNWLLLYICRKNTYQSAVIRSISQYLAPKFASLSQPQKPEVEPGESTVERYLQIITTTTVKSVIITVKSVIITLADTCLNLHNLNNLTLFLTQFSSGNCSYFIVIRRFQRAAQQSSTAMYSANSAINNNLGLKRSLSGCTKPKMHFCKTLHNCLV